MLKKSPEQRIHDRGEEDAIFRRTRARHSLAEHTLDELEAFLQDSEDDELQNAEDEAEYRKFLAAVLLEGATDGGISVGEEDENEDEENDADFELEIEEALESDNDEYLDNSASFNHFGGKAAKPCRPVTRQKKELQGRPATLFRPILPYTSNKCIASLPSPLTHFSSCQSPLPLGPTQIHGFMPHQIGRLYCLIHEHVQLLIQVYSLCVLDPAKKSIAEDTRKLILEMVNRKEEALSMKKCPYPGFCFYPDHIFSSEDFHVNETNGSSTWRPEVQDSILSILDVAPLRIVASYLNDVLDAVQKYTRQLYISDSPDKARSEREPLFSLPSCETSDEAIAAIGTVSSGATPPHSPVKMQPKKSLATRLVESSMKDPIALVPKVISDLARRFHALFNPSLFPHQAPIAPVSNRVLFTGAEDKLLAMGLMEYNGDWKAIQQRYLPCKSTKQIFIRQKNQSSSKALENPIKVVRRIKNSPLTADEMARIAEGLKIFKNDWFSVCKFFLPHRDPTLLQRQWRIASGIQKSYKKSDAHRLRRREYEAKRRQSKTSVSNCQTSHQEIYDKGDTELNAEDDEEAYVHEAFLAEIQPGTKHVISDISPVSPLLTCTVTQSEKAITCSNQQLQPDPEGSRLIDGKYASSSNQQTSKVVPTSSSIRVTSRHGVAHKNKGVRLVKLAPDLPLVNLPPSGRVISQSAFKAYHNSSVPKFSGSVECKKLSCLPCAKATKVSVYQQDGTVHGNQVGVEDNDTAESVHMHPLLFRPSEGSSFHVLNYTRGSSDTSNFFLSRSPPRAETDLVNPLCSSRARKEASSSLSAIDFHPLLQRGVDAQHSYGFASVQRNHGHPSTPSNHAFGNNTINRGNDACREASPSHVDKEIDLNINLCSSTLRERPRGSGIAQNYETATISHLGKGNGEHNERDKLHKCSLSTSADGRSVAFVMNETNSGDSCEEAIQEIIMEQEELSDSDEEHGHVEFEREEIDDSEGEGCPTP